MLKSNLILLFTMTMFLMVSISTASGAVQNVASITNEEDKGVIQLQLITDENADVTHLQLKYRDEKGKLYDTSKYTAAKAASGIVLYKKKGRDVVKLSSDNFSGHQGGEIELDYLYSGISGSRDIKLLDLSRNGDDWELTDKRKNITKLHFVSNKAPIVGTIGVKRIDTK
jgi:hypothetical protein